MDMVKNDVKQRIAIVTGAAKGIGRATAVSLAQKGIIPVIADINIEAAKQVVDEIIQMNFKASSYEIDVSNVNQITKMVEYVVNTYGHVDILVNNAGILNKTPIEDITEDEWDRVMNINLKSAMFCSQQVLKYMIQQGWGRIVSIASMAGRMGGYSTSCAYSASKAAMIGMTMCIARKVAKYNVTVNAIAPGPTESELLRGFTDEEIRKLEEGIPVGKLGKPENIAETVAFFVSDAASFITGAVLDVNGGTFMG